MGEEHAVAKSEAKDAPSEIPFPNGVRAILDGDAVERSAARLREARRGDVLPSGGRLRAAVMPYNFTPEPLESE